MLDTENNMPTIQDELKKALGQWNPTKPEESTPQHKNRSFPVTSNVSRVTFEYVKSNPGTTAAQASKALLAQGQKPSSVSSIMAQMATMGTMRKEGFRYFVVAPEFVPVSIPALRAARDAKNASMQKVETIVNSALKKANDKFMGQLDAPEQPTPTITKHSPLDMPLREAHALYIELSKYFGARSEA